MAGESWIKAIKSVVAAEGLMDLLKWHLVTAPYIGHKCCDFT